MRKPLALAMLLITTPALAELPTRETPLGQLTLRIAPESFKLSPDQRRLAFVAVAETAQEPTRSKPGNPLEPPPLDAEKKRPPARVWLDNKPHKSYAAITMPVFSPDSQKLAYAADIGGAWKIIIDGVEQPAELQGVPDTPVVFSPDSKRMAVVARIKNQWHVSVDDQLSPPFDGIGNNTFTFSPDSKSVAYVIKSGTGWQMMVNHAPAGTYKQFSTYRWAPNSALVAVIAKDKSDTQLFAGKFVSEPYAAFARNMPIFSADGRRVAFAAADKPLANKAANWFVGIGDVATGEAANTSPKLGAVLDGTPVFVGETLYYFALTKDNRWQLYADHKPVGDPVPAVAAYSLTASPDGKHYAYSIVRNNASIIIRDGKPAGTYDELGVGTWSWSPDSQRLAVAARKKDRWQVIADGYEGPPVLSVGQSQITFSADSKTVAYTAMDIDKKWRLYVNDKYSTPVDAFARGSYVVLTDTQAQTIAVKNRQAVRLEVEPK